MTSATKKTFRAKKSLGQHFLADQNIVRKIIESCALSNEDLILEIGPGQGALTKIIAPRVKQLIAVEKDRDLAPQLMSDFNHSDNVRIIHEDILEFSFETLSAGTKLIGNLPYNISTPIIEKILTHKKIFSSIYIMVQLEYGQRLIAKPGTKDYSSFTLFTNFHADIEMLFKINKGCFNPPPKVQSCFLKLTPKPERSDVDETTLFRVIHSAFQQRRKTIENSLTGVCAKEKVRELLESLGIDKKLRAENLTIDDYIRIANALE